MKIETYAVVYNTNSPDRKSDYVCLVKICEQVVVEGCKSGYLHDRTRNKIAISR